VLDRASDRAYSFALAGYERASFVSDYSQRFSEYTAKGQQHGQDFDNPEDASRVTASTTDKAIGRYRPKIIRPEGSVNKLQAQKRINWQANRDLGKSLRFTATMTGFRDQAGDLWQKNRLIYVKDDRLGVDNLLLIESLRFRQAPRDGVGSVTELTLVHPGAYALEPAAIEQSATKLTKRKKTESTNSYFDL